MRAYRSVIVGVMLVAIVGVVGYVVSKHDAGAQQAASPAEPLPATNVEPVSRLEATRASTPDPVSDSQSVAAVNPEPLGASRLDMRSLATCHAELLKKKGVESLSDCDKIPASDTAGQNFCRSIQAKTNQRLQEAAAGAAPCPAEIGRASGYYKAMRTLAVQGDVAAQRCFIQGYFGTASGEGEESKLLDEQLNEYPSLARQFINAAFERGDWSVVRWLSRTRLEVSDGLLAQAYPIGIDHLETAYRMNYLLVLGNQPDGRRKGEPRRLIDFWKTNQKLGSQQISEAEAWAHDMFDQHFNGSQEGAVLTQFCEHS